MIEINNKSAPASLDLFIAANPHTKMGEDPNVNLSRACGRSRLNLGLSRRTALQGFAGQIADFLLPSAARRLCGRIQRRFRA